MSDTVKILKNTKTHVMTGVSHMIPFVVAGGVTLAVCVLLSGKAAMPTDGALGQIATIGSAGLGLMVPVLSGFIAYSIADRPGLAPGFIGGIISSNIGAGFLGGLVSGLLAGIVVTYLKRIKLNDSIKSVLPIFIIPLAGSLIVGCAMLFLIGTPIAALMSALENWLNSISTGNAIILGLALGAMISFDMGGPVNKVAYSFGVAMVGTIGANGLPTDAAMHAMAAIGASIAVPPIACFFATLIFRKRFTVAERDSGTAALLMGCVGITEGAIPFAAASPIRTIPPLMIGGAISGSIAMALGAGNPAPWGGLIVMPVCENPLGYFVAVLIGSLIGGVLMGLLHKSTVKTEATDQNVNNDVDDLDLQIEF